jgi:mannose-6-phosphate isomerase-like protein (cupin superfamily)
MSFKLMHAAIVLLKKAINMSARQTDDSPRFQIEQLDSNAAEACPCGMTRRAFTDDAEQIASMHVVDVTVDAQTHYHKRLTELYYVLEGEGEMELDGRRYPVRPGSAVLIKPGCRHRAIGQFKILNVPIPAFDPADEWFD